MSVAARSRAASQPSAAPTARQMNTTASVEKVTPGSLPEGYDEIGEGTVDDMKVFLLLLLIIVAVIAIIGAPGRGGPARQQQQLDDARADAQRWYERLGGQ